MNPRIATISERLARPLEEAASTYDVVVVGSGYGGGVSASRLARAGFKVAVLERGREVVTGEFPSRFPDMRQEMRVTGTSMAIGDFGVNISGGRSRIFAVSTGRRGKPSK